MEKTTVKQRLTIFAKSKERSVRAFEKNVGLTIGYINAIRISVPPDKIKKIVSCYPDLNTSWLLTGEGEMLRNPYLEQPNNIISHITYTSPQFDNESLQRIGIRIAEVARLKHTDLQGLAKTVNADYKELVAVVNADLPATDILIVKIAVAYPDINPYWLATGQSTPIIKDLLPDFNVNKLSEKLEAAEKLLKEKDYIISLQKETIDSHKKQIALLEEKTAAMHYTAPSKNPASSKGKTADASGITLG